MFRRITKREAFKRFSNGQDIVLCPHKMMPGGPFAMHSTLYGARLEDRIAGWQFPLPINPGPLQMTLRALEAMPTVWESTIREWAYYNASHECGYYPAYYIQE